MSEPLVQIDDAYRIYRVEDVEIPAVRGVSMSVEHGEFVAITGASGSGKSTFMHIVGCLDQMTRGSFRFEGVDVNSLTRKELARLRNRRIGFVFQSFNLLSRTTIVDNAALPLAYQGVGLRERRRRACEMLARLGLGDRLGHHPNQLSGGQQQRVAIARALVTHPVVLLADEPTGNLDSRTTAEIMELFAELNRDEGITVFIVTHEDEVADYAARHLVFRDGRILSDNRRVRHATPNGAAMAFSPGVES